MSEYQPHICVHHPGDPGPCVPPFLLSPESSDEDWKLFYASDGRFAGRPNVLDIYGRLSEAEALKAAQEYLLKYGPLYVNIEVQLDE